MRRPTPRSESSRTLLRAYLLDTADTADRCQVEAWIAASEAWQQALEREKEALARLDILSEESPRRDLVEAALQQVREEPPLLRPAFFDWIQTHRGMTLTLAAAAVFLLVLLPFARVYQSVSGTNMTQLVFKQWGVAFKMYSGENKGQYPPVSRYKGLWTPDLESLWPEYLTDPKQLVNPSVYDYKKKLRRVETLLQKQPVDWEAITQITAEGFIYTGHAIRSGEDTRLLLAQGNTRTPLREGIERFFITDINNPAASTATQSLIPVLFEPIHGTIRRSTPKYTVLFMDGHIEPMRLGNFPVNDDGAGLLIPSDK